jgi:hypothetical protein
MAEGAMKRQWRVQRAAVAMATGQQWWDQAYQLLLQLATQQPEAAAPSSADREEATHARSALRPRLDDAAGAAADD